jgi:hypothetical protein
MTDPMTAAGECLSGSMHLTLLINRKMPSRETRTELNANVRAADGELMWQRDHLTGSGKGASINSVKMQVNETMKAISQV